MKKILVSLILIFTASVLSVGVARADSVDLMNVIAGGDGPGPGGFGEESANINGTFLFDSTTDVAWNFSFSGTSSLGTSETWGYSGPVSGIAAQCCANEVFIYYPANGSLGDQLPFEFILMPDQYILGGSPSPDNLLPNSDVWAGTITATPVPEPATWMLILAGGLVMLVVKLKVA